MDAVWVGFDALDLPREAFGYTWPMVDFTFRVFEGDVGVRVDDARHSQVLVDALTSPLVFGLHSTGDFEPVLFQGSIGSLPEFTTFVGLRRLVFASVQSNVNDGR